LLLPFFFCHVSGDNGFKSINGVSYQIFPERKYHPNPNPLQVRLGERVWIRFTNYNADNHAMHLHGHVFQVRFYRVRCAEF
jgi:FtsP/CotA-like multicopper oxidase with cupredoxin domain